MNHFVCNHTAGMSHGVAQLLLVHWPSGERRFHAASIGVNRIDFQTVTAELSESNHQPLIAFVILGQFWRGKPGYVDCIRRAGDGGSKSYFDNVLRTEATPATRI